MNTVATLLSNKAAGIHALPASATVLEAIRLMADQQIGSVLVMDGKQLSGIFTERDYARKVVLLGRASMNTPISEIMSSPVKTVQREDTVNHCMTLMTQSRIRHLPVVNDGEVIGLLSIGDLVKAVIEQQAREIDELQRYIAG